MPDIQFKGKTAIESYHHTLEFYQKLWTALHSSSVEFSC
jgi:hypothetical protein